MACIVKRRGKYVVDYRDGGGRRRWITCDTREQAKDSLREALSSSRQRVVAAVAPTITVKEMAARFLTEMAVKPRTRLVYVTMLEKHILPTFGSWKMRQIERRQVKRWVLEQKGRYKSGTVRVMLAVLRCVCEQAVEDGVLVGNPAAKLGRRCGIGRAQDVTDDVKAMMPEQLTAFLAAARKVAPDWLVLFTTLFLTGMRIGEACGLEWEDVDFDAGTMRVKQSAGSRRRGIERMGSVKRGGVRVVDMAPALARELRRHLASVKEGMLRRGTTELPRFVFTNPTGEAADSSIGRRWFRRACDAAGLPVHLTPHSLRHTFASGLLAAGVPIDYVQRQLGHASIQMTVDIYGKWLPHTEKAVGRLDAWLNEGKAHERIA